MRTLGSNGPSVFDLALGCMGMSDLCGPADDADSIATISLVPLAVFPQSEKKEDRHTQIALLGTGTPRPDPLRSGPPSCGNADRLGRADLADAAGQVGLVARGRSRRVPCTSILT